MRSIRLIFVCPCHHILLTDSTHIVDIINIRKKLHTSFRYRRRNFLHRTSESYLYNFFPYDLFQEADMRKSYLKTKSKFHISQSVLVSRHMCLALSFEHIVLSEDEKSRVF